MLLLLEAALKNCSACLGSERLIFKGLRLQTVLLNWQENCLNLIEELETKRSNIQKMSQYLTQCDEYIAVMKVSTVVTDHCKAPTLG